MKLKLLAYFLATALVVIEVYLISASILEHYNEKKDVQIFCQIKCAHNQNSDMWEFSGETITKGFTTKNECYNYCAKVRQGFIYALIKNSSDFLGALFNFK